MNPCPYYCTARSYYYAHAQSAAESEAESASEATESVTTESAAAKSESAAGSCPAFEWYIQLPGPDVVDPATGLSRPWQKGDGPSPQRLIAFLDQDGLFHNAALDALQAQLTQQADTIAALTQQLQALQALSQTAPKDTAGSNAAP